MAADWKLVAASSPAAFAAVTSGGRLQIAKHWRLMDDALVAMARGKIKRLIVNVPPQFGKSELVSKHFPAWYLGLWPDKKVILTSYESTYAASWGMKAREVFREYAPHVMGTRINPERATMEWWETMGGGYMATAGAGGAITGKGADILIIDDPYKGYEDAHSEHNRNKVWDWFMSVAMTRLQPNGSIIIIQTRWHEDDLTGRLLRMEGDKWHKIILPALDENNESLFPERYTAAELLERKKSMGSYIFNALYQQSPAPPEGNVFRKGWWRYWNELPQFDTMVNSWDLTFDVDGSSYTVGLVVGMRGANAYVVHMERGKWAFPEQVRKIKSMRTAHHETREVLIEKKANGAAAISTIQGEVPGVIPIVPTESKEARAAAVSWIVEAGNVYLPNRAEWKDVFVNEMASFPNGSNNDIVDALTQALNRLFLRQQASSGRAAF